MLNRRSFLTMAAAAATMPTAALAQVSLKELKPGVSGSVEAGGPRAPSAVKIQRQLEKEPEVILAPEERVPVERLKRNNTIRRHAPSIDIQAINFEFGSAEIPYDQYWKIEEIAIAMRRILRRRRFELFLIEGHTDAVGSRYSNYQLSFARARSLKRVLVREFGIPGRVLETEGYGEDYLLVPVPYAEWRNRRVTLRRITEFVRG